MSALPLTEILTGLAMTALHALWLGALAAALFAASRGLRLWSRPQAGYAFGVSLLAGVLVAVLLTGWSLLQQQLPLKLESSVIASPVAAGESAVLAVGTSTLLDQRWLEWLGACWLLAIMISAGRTLRAWLALRRVVRLAQRVPELERRLAQLGQRLRSTRVVCSALEHAPFVMGLLRPVIVIPASALTGLAPAQVDAILLHELAHVRRFDLWINLMQVVLETLLCFHPAVHWLSNEIRKLREECCDDLVLGGGVSPSLYARTLLALEERRQLSAQLAPGALAGALLQRIDRIARSAGRPEEAARAARNVTQNPARAARNVTQNAASSPLGVLLAAAALTLVVLALGLRMPGLQGLELVPDRRPLMVETGGLPRSAPSPLSTLELRLPPVVIAPVAADASPVPAAARITVERPSAAPLPPLEISAPQPVPVALPVAPMAAQLTVTTPPEIPSAEPPRPLKVVAPEYPASAQRDGLNGVVTLSFSLDANGHPQQIEVEQVAGNSRFRAAAIAALRQWRYAPESASALAGARLRQSFDFVTEGGVRANCSKRTGTRLCSG